MQANIIIGGALCLVGIALIIVCNFMTFSIIEEINARGPSERQISWSFIQFKMDEILRRHKELFPNSAKRRNSTIVGIAGGILLFAGFFVATS